jgi:hypothetical protein
VEKHGKCGHRQAGSPLASKTVIANRPATLKKVTGSFGDTSNSRFERKRVSAKAIACAVFAMETRGKHSPMYSALLTVTKNKHEYKSFSDLPVLRS